MKRLGFLLASCFISRRRDDCSENKSSVQITSHDEIKSPNSDIIIENLPDAEFSDPAHELRNHFVKVKDHFSSDVYYLEKEIKVFSF